MRPEVATFSRMPRLWGLYTSLRHGSFLQETSVTSHEHFRYVIYWCVSGSASIQGQCAESPPWGAKAETRS